MHNVHVYVAIHIVHAYVGIHSLHVHVHIHMHIVIAGMHTLALLPVSVKYSTLS